MARQPKRSAVDALGSGDTTGGQVPGVGDTSEQTAKDPPEYARGWHRFPDSDVHVRIGADRKLAAGIYQITWALGAYIYVLLEELPDSDSGVAELLRRWRDAGKEVVASHGTRFLHDNEVAIYAAEPTMNSERPTGFLVVGSRGDFGPAAGPVEG